MTSENATVRDVQNRIYEVLKYIDRVCRENDIEYFLSGGTLLGAIRHKGFIPWDDDADVMLKRPEYERLLKVLKKNKDKRFVLGSVETDSDWDKPWARIWDSTTRIRFDSIQDNGIGVFVDVLPIDAVPENYKMFKLFNYRVKFLNVLRNASIRTSFVEGEKHRFIKKILGFFAARHSGHYHAARVNRVCAAKKYGSTRHCGVTVLSHYMEKERFKCSCFDRTIEVCFETSRFMAPVGFDDYLRQLYGEYMKLPPVEKQKSEHLFRIMTTLDEQ